MSLEQEEQFIGTESHLVPKIDTGEYCNAKKTERNDDGKKVFRGYCQAVAGKGTDHLGDGRCKYHGGAIEGAGAPKGNQNAQTHALNADPHNYHQSLPHEEKEFVRDASAAIEDRVRANTGEVDYLDRIMARRIAIEFHIVSKASDYVENVSGLTETIMTEQGSQEKKAALVAEIRKRDKDIFQMLTDLGVLDDPESKKADALEQWRSWVEEGSRGSPESY